MFLEECEEGYDWVCDSIGGDLIGEGFCFEFRFPLSDVTAGP